MKNNPLKTGDISINSKGVGSVTPEMVKTRAAEISRINDRSPQAGVKADTDQAQRELTGGNETDSKEEFLESVAEGDRWNMPAGSVGKKIVPNGNEDEDDEGRSDNERLVEEGISEAENDQMNQAAKVDRKNEDA